MPGKSWHEKTRLLQTEDWWAVWVGLLVILLSLAGFWAGSPLVKDLAVTPGKWSDPDGIARDFQTNFRGYLAIFFVLLAVFSLSMKIMGHSLKQFVPGFVVIFVGALAIFYLAGWAVMERWDLGAPLLALIAGLVVGNLIRVPGWLKTSMRVEFYIKTGIVLLGATLPLTLIVRAGGLAFLQATVVSLCTWFAIFLAATRLFHLDKRFGAVLGAGGAVCGVSASIAVGGAVGAKKDQIAISIGVVSVWAIIMIFVLTFVTKQIIPADGVVHPDAPWYAISPGEAGAWIGTSEYADAAGLAVVAELAGRYGDLPIHAFTLMKVIGRDIWIGLWAFILSVVSVAFWEEKEAGAGAGVIWERFPKFVFGFFAACLLMSLIAASAPADHVGVAKTKDTFKGKTGKVDYQADFSSYTVPAELADRFRWDPEKGIIACRGRMSLEDLERFSRAAVTEDQKTALKQLYFKSDWEESELTPKAIGPVKQIRSWVFVLCFLCIGLTTRFKELATFGVRPFWAFTIGVAVNVPLGYFLSAVVFQDYWRLLGR